MITGVIRVRGKVGIKQEIRDTFKMLRLDKSYSLILLPENPIYKGMVKKVKDYSIYGPISEPVIKEVLKMRLLTNEGSKADEKLVDKAVKALKKGNLLKDVEGIKPVIRLQPPKGGFRRKGLKKTVKQGGDLGFHESIDEIVKKMV